MPQSAGLHEENVTPQTRDRHRALASLGEELEAIDWYDQRVDVTGDAELKAILAHNRDEEKEHASMVLEWLRRRDAAFDTKLREYLFTEGSIVRRETALEREAAAAGGDTGRPIGDGSLGIGSLKVRSA
ncbi:MAG TPA: ferritin-like domain-containing protein [Candidatus Binatia bacterium]|nr:ferritin-like domain-containing protein [Candidatus Binatia bacterium]